MNLTHLRYAVEVEKTGSISRAAKNLFMGQPNLSKAIRELEASMGTIIFRRTRRGVEATEAGGQILSYAKSILAQIDTLESLYQPCMRDIFRLSVSVPRAAHFPAALAEFLGGVAADVAMDVRYRETSAADAVNNVMNGESSIAIARYEAGHEEYYMGLLKSMKLRPEPLWGFKLRLLLPGRHPLARETEITPDMLSGYPQILHGEAPAPTAPPMSCDFPMRPGGQGRRNIHVCDVGNQLRLLQHLEGAYLWSSPAPPTILREYGLVSKGASPPPMEGCDILLYKEDHVLTLSEQGFVTAVKKCAEDADDCLL